MSWDSGLDGTALAIAQCDENPLRVMAGPGTGKSFAIQRRVARLLEVDSADPRRILAVTFTRNAAAGLVKDLHSLRIAGSDEILSGTLHSFCFSLLARQSVFDYLGRVARPMITFNKKGVAQFEHQPLLVDLGSHADFGGKRESTKRIRAFEAAWARLQHQTPGWPIDPVDRQFHQELSSWLRFHRAMLIGELVPEALRFLRDNPGAPETCAFDHVVVDEYQDLNKAEQVLLDILSKNGRLVVVGDVDQSIYSFRYANPEGIVEFSERHPSTHDEPLQECRRCPKRVVALADYLICHNHIPTTEVRLNPKTENPEGKVFIVQWNLPSEEAQGLAQYVQHLIADQGYRPDEILVLSPRRLLGYEIRDALRKMGVPTHSFFHEESLESDKAQEAFTLLRLLTDLEDRVSLRFWLGLGSPSWNTGEYGRLRAHCESSGMSPIAALTQLLVGDLTIDRTSRIQERFRALITQLSELKKLIECSDLVDRLFPDVKDWAKPMREVSLSLLDSVSTPAELLEELRIQITQPEMPLAGEFVRVMSLHKSKGLTSKVAIIAGCVEGLIPTTDSEHTADEALANLREQRRLFYVSMTRCREVLVLSSFLALPSEMAYRIGARIKNDYGIGRTVASRFFSELGPTRPPGIRGGDWVSQRFA